MKYNLAKRNTEFLYSEWKNHLKIDYFYRKNKKIIKFHRLSYYYEIDIMQIKIGEMLWFETNTFNKIDNFN